MGYIDQLFLFEEGGNIKLADGSNKCLTVNGGRVPTFLVVIATGLES